MATAKAAKPKARKVHKPARRRKAPPPTPPPQQLQPDTTPADPGAQASLLFIPQRQAGVRVTGDTALTLGTIFACRRVISEDLGKLPMNVYRRRPDGGRERVPDHPADWLLSMSANPETPAPIWRELMVGWALLRGNGYAEVERDALGRPAWLWQLHPDRVTPDRDRSGALVYKVWNPGGVPETVLPAADVFHLRGPSDDGLVGIDVVRYAAREIGYAISLTESAASLSGNDSTPGGVLTHPQRLSEKARENLRKTWQARHGGPTNRRTVAILEEGMSWAQTSISPEHAQLVEQFNVTPAMICRWFRVAPHKVADLSRATFSNIEEQNTDHVGDALMPWARRLECEADVKLFGRNSQGTLFTKVNFLGLLRGKAAERAAYYNTLHGLGVFSADDINELEDRNPIGGKAGSARFVPLNMQLLETAADPPPPPVPMLPPAPEPDGEDDTEEEPPPDEEEEGPDAEAASARVRAALLCAAEDAFGRLLRIEAKWARDALARGDDLPGRLARFLPGHERYAREALAAPAAAYAIATRGTVPVGLPAAVAALAADHLEGLKDRLQGGGADGWPALAGALADAFLSRVETALRACA